MSVAAATSHGYSGLPLDSTLVWARSAAFTPPHALTAITKSTPSSCLGLAAPMSASLPLPEVAQQPACRSNKETLCVASGFFSAFNHDCSDNCALQVSWDLPQSCSPVACTTDLRMRQSEPSRNRSCLDSGCSFTVPQERTALGAQSRDSDNGCVNSLVCTHSPDSGAAVQVETTAATLAMAFNDVKLRGFAAAAAGLVEETVHSRVATLPMPFNETWLGGSYRGCNSGTIAAAATPDGVSWAYASPGWLSPLSQLGPLPLTGSQSSSSAAASRASSIITAAPRRIMYGVRTSAMMSQTSIAERYVTPPFVTSTKSRRSSSTPFGMGPSPRILFTTKPLWLVTWLRCMPVSLRPVASASPHPNNSSHCHPHFTLTWT